MTELYGDFDEHLPPSQEYLRIQFSPSSVPLKQRWRNNGLSAGFMADFLLTFFPKQDNEPDAENNRTEIQDTICYIANELLENAMKFTDDTSLHPISITLYLLADRLVFLATNSTSADHQKSLRDFIHCLAATNPDELYAKRIERSALEVGDSSAGLGLLTMINDYWAKIGWKLEIIQENPAVFTVTTMVQLTI